MSVRIATICPWPEQPSGIADSAYAHVKALVDHCPCEVVIYTENPNPVAMDGVTIHALEDFHAHEQQSPYDAIVVHMGNNEFHVNYLEYLERYKCIVHLHDMVLHHLVTKMTLVENKTQEYFSILEKHYGTNVREMVEALVAKGCGVWDLPCVIDMPLFEPFLEHASACLVSSDFVAGRVRAAMPELPVHRIDLLLHTSERIAASCRKHADVDDTCFNIGVFGIVSPFKKVDVMARVAERLLSEHDNVRLHVVGSVSEPCRDLLEFERKTDGRIRFYGRVNEDDFMCLQSSMHVNCALRYPTMGETSGVVVDSLSVGVPLVVVDVGSYSETPKFVKKLTVDDMEEELYSYLRDLLLHPEQYARLKEMFSLYSSCMDSRAQGIVYFKAIMKEISLQAPF
jgi:glycosyltransferase involved in cell wall biosynthesis